MIPHINRLLWPCLLALVACTQQPAATETAKEPLAETPLSWMRGTWEVRSDSVLIREHWEQVSATAFEGEAFELLGSDTVVRELLRMEQIGDSWVYIAKVNQHPPVLFTLNPMPDNANELIFENSEHDFPQYLRYTRQPDGNMHAEAGGRMADGRMVKQEYPFVRVSK